MHTRHLLLIVIPALFLLVACGPVSPEAAQPTPTPITAATLLTVWPAESAVAFTASALGGNLTIHGSYGVDSGRVTLQPEADALRVHAYLLIDTPSVTAGSAVIDEALKLGMETTVYPIATFDAVSTTLVPVTEESVTFTLEGTLTLHGQTQPVTMAVNPATVIDNHMEASARMQIDLADFGISLPGAVVDSEITLDVLLIADVDSPPPTAAPPAE